MENSPELQRAVEIRLRLGQYAIFPVWDTSQRTRGAFQGRLRATKRRSDGLFLKLKARDGRDRGREDQHALGRRVVQVRPGRLDLDQLSQTVLAKVTDGELVVCFGRVRAKLAIEARPREAVAGAAA